MQDKYTYTARILSSLLILQQNTSDKDAKRLIIVNLTNDNSSEAPVKYILFENKLTEHETNSRNTRRHRTSRVGWAVVKRLGGIAKNEYMQMLKAKIAKLYETRLFIISHRSHFGPTNISSSRNRKQQNGTHVQS